MKKYYCYFYNREDGTPYYVGKGCNGRINSKSHPGISLPLKERRIKVADNLTEEDAIQMEKMYIKKYGRKDLGTGILYNKTDGGENPPCMKKGNNNHIAGVQKFWDNLSVEDRKKRGKKISNTKKGKGNHIPSKSVMINELNKKFQSIKECADYISGDTSAICKCLNKKGQTRHRGYTFSRV
jgi:hypothetical protein